jgi:cell division protein FtsZ
MGKAMMGTGEAGGENRAGEAADAAIANPLLDNVSMKGAKGVLISITGGPDLTLFEVDEAANRIREEVDQDANIIFGSTFDESLEGKIRVSIVATGIDAAEEGNVTSLFNESSSVASEDLSEEVGAVESEENISDEFIAPEPKEVELDDAVAEEEAVVEVNNGLSVSEKPFSPKAKSRGLGIFGRFIASNEKESESDPIQKEVVSEPVIEESYETGDAEENNTKISESKTQTDDFLDIPAFMRRKSG